MLAAEACISAWRCWRKMGEEESGGGLVSVVIPAYNEQRRIGGACRAVREYFRQMMRPCEILVVNDGSTDATGEIIREMSSEFDNLRRIDIPVNRGKGLSVKTGVLSSRGDTILVTDADLSTPITEVSKLFKCLENGYDLAIGSRGLRVSLVSKHQPFWREYSGKIFNVIMRCMLPLQIRDTQCGFKLFRGDAARDIFRRQTVDGFCFDAEILLIGQEMGFRIIEVPVVWYNSDHTTVRFSREAVRMFSDLVRIRRNERMGLYGRPR